MPENDRHKIPEGSIRTMHSDEDHLHKKGMVIPEVDTDVLVEKKLAPLPSTGTPKKHGDNVFDVSGAFKGESELGTFVTDKKHKKRSIFGVLRDAATEWTTDKTETVKNMEVFQKPEVPTVAPGTKRKDVIEKAITKLDQLPRDDHRVVVERIKTFQHDAERATGKPFYIKPKEERTKQAGWSHVVSDTETTPTPSSAQGTILSDSVKAQQIRREAITPEMHEQGAAPQVDERINAPIDAYIPQKSIDPRVINRAEITPDKNALGALPNTDKRTELKTYDEPLVTPNESTIDARFAAFKNASKEALPETEVASQPVAEEEALPQKGPKRLVFAALISGAVLLIALAGTGAYYYVESQRAAETLVVDAVTPATSLISTDIRASVLLPTDRATLLVNIDAALRAQRARLTHIAIETEQEGIRSEVSTADFFRILAPRVPSSFVRSLGNSMMAGGVGLETPTPYFIFTTNSFDATFAGMLDWEPYMSADLAPLFGTAVSRSLDADARTGDRTGAARFVDTTLNGTNARVLTDETGSSRIVYGFTENNTMLIITTSETAFTELSSRF